MRVSNKPAYAILGTGKWATVVAGILVSEGHKVVLLGGTRRGRDEEESAYVDRISKLVTTSGADIVWLCTPPGPHVPLMAEAAIEARRHIVIEKPWLFGSSTTDPLHGKAKAAGLITAVHYEYCLLEGVEAWRQRFMKSADLEFFGTFTISRPDRVGLTAFENLACHLFAIRAYAVPHARLGTIKSAYESIDERKVWLEEKGEKVVAQLEFSANPEPVIQRFIAGVTGAIEGEEFLLDIKFAARVFEDMQTQS